MDTAAASSKTGGFLTFCPKAKWQSSPVAGTKKADTRIGYLLFCCRWAWCLSAGIKIPMMQQSSPLRVRSGLMDAQQQCGFRLITRKNIPCSILYSIVYQCFGDDCRTFLSQVPHIPDFLLCQRNHITNTQAIFINQTLIWPLRQT